LFRFRSDDAESAKTDTAASIDSTKQLAADDSLMAAGDGAGRPRKRRPRRQRRKKEQALDAQGDEARAPDPLPAQIQPAESAPPWNVSAFSVQPVEGKMRFHDLNLPDVIMHGIFDLGFQYCTPVQAAVLPYSLKGVDSAGRAQTGTGKSAVFLITILTHLLRSPAVGKRLKGSPRALVLAPTRELALQIEKDARALARHFPCEIVSVFGGTDYVKQRQSLTNGHVDLMVATPGRLLDFSRQAQLHLHKVEILVIDEADRMLDMGFIPDVSEIVRKTPARAKRQTMLFSATLTPEVTRLASQWTTEPILVEIEPEQVAVDTVEQIVYLTTIEEKFVVLLNLILQKKLERALVFCNRRDETRRLTEHLRLYGVKCDLLSGDVKQNRRIKALEDFRSGKIRVLIATDVAGRGLHVDDISHVVNYHLPLDADAYVHRIGRTGRAGASGVSISFATEQDSFQIPGIEEYLGRELRCEYPDDELLKPLPEPHKKPATTPRRRPARTIPAGAERKRGRRP
jgi:ATP-dependent RNA helicase RhlB